MMVCGLCNDTVKLKMLSSAELPEKVINPLKTNINLNYILISSFYFAENAIHILYKNQMVNAVYPNYYYLL
jgi:hypothetical protein